MLNSSNNNFVHIILDLKDFEHESANDQMC